MVNNDNTQERKVIGTLSAIKKKLTLENQCKKALTKTHEIRLDKLKEIACHLKGNKNVQNRRLKTWLTDQEYESFLQLWEEQKTLRLDMHDKPEILKDYETLLKKATLWSNRADGYAAKGKKGSATEMRKRADLGFELAYEKLHEILTSQPDLQLWLDRSFSIDPELYPALTPVDAPRVVTSRSVDALGGGLHIHLMTKLEVKLKIVQDAIEALE